MPKTLCEICDNDKFDNINGFYYCTVCSTQSKVDKIKNRTKNKIKK